VGPRLARGNTNPALRDACFFLTERTIIAAMNESVSGNRALAGRIAKWLVEKERPDDAVEVLCAWAVQGPNDPEGQTLLAEALRIDPGAKIAQSAFEQMEGIEDEHDALTKAIAKYSAPELSRLDTEMRRPTFRRAQMGFNNNIKFREQVFHVQTEDSGLDQPHIITHLFADGGRVVKSHKRSYAQEVNRPDVAEYVRGLMKAQHLEMVALLRDGRFDRVLDGLEVGGVQVLTEPPSVDVRKLASQKKSKTEARAAAQAQPTASQPVPAEPAPTERYFTLHVLRCLTGGPDRYEPVGAHSVIGSSGAITLPGETFAHGAEAQLNFDSGQLWLEDMEGGNGVFLRIRTPVELGQGDEFVVGDQLLRVEANPIPNDGPDPDPTYFYSSPKWPSSFRIVQVFEGGANGACVVARGNTLQVGSAIGDLIFPDDPLVAEQHCLIEEQAGTVVLTDLTSRTGVFVRIRGQQELLHGDELLIGRTRLVVDLSQKNKA
jgi:pSer/pThr/pTyr-binding forkhead associated (FHA) protein